MQSWEYTEAFGEVAVENYEYFGSWKSEICRLYSIYGNTIGVVKLGSVNGTVDFTMFAKNKQVNSSLILISQVNILLLYFEVVSVR